MLKYVGIVIQLNLTVVDTFETQSQIQLKIDLIRLGRLQANFNQVGLDRNSTELISI